MIRGLYTAALGMTTQMKKMDVVSNNIANSDVTGFKRDIVVTQSFSQELMKRLDDPNSSARRYQKDTPVGPVSLGVFVDNVVTDFSAGGLQNTNAPLDIAINGDGFFAVSVMDASGNATTKYTRDGSFTVSSDGTLVTKEGNPVLGQNGIIKFNPNGDITIDETGNIFINNQRMNRLAIINFKNPESLRKAADNLYDITPESQETAFRGTVLQGCLENSNISSVKEMVEMISLSRAYEANQRIIGMLDTTMGQAASDIARRA